MNTVQTIISALLSDSALITEANGYQRTLRQAVKGFIGLSEANNNYQQFFYLGTGKVIEKNESETVGTIEQEIYLGVHFKVDDKRGNVTDEIEILLQDYSDWVIGTFGTGKKLTLNGNTLLETIFISEFFHPVEWKNNQTTCGITLTVRYTQRIG